MMDDGTDDGEGETTLSGLVRPTLDIVGGNTLITATIAGTLAKARDDRSPIRI